MGPRRPDRRDPAGSARFTHEHGFPGAIVAHAWFDTDNAEEVIAAQAAFPLVRGIRSKPVTAPSPDRIELGAPGTMQDERWLRGFALLEKYGLSWDLRVPFWHLRRSRCGGARLPETPIVLNHTGFPWDRSEEGLAAWRRAMEALAREPNVWVKISEFGLKDRPWEYEVEPQRRCWTRWRSSASSARSSRPISRSPDCASATGRWSTAVSRDAGASLVRRA